MSSYIPDVDLEKFNGETARVLAETAREQLMQGSQDTMLYADTLRPMIASTLRRFGLDEKGGWGGRSGEADKAAKKVVAALRRAADAQESAAAHYAAFEKLFQKHVNDPIEYAKRLQSQGKRETLNY